MITYVKYSASKAKGQTGYGEEFNSPFALQNMDETYTSQAVVENVAAGATEATPVWQPLVKKAFAIITLEDGTIEEFNPRRNKYTKAELDTIERKDVKVIHNDGSVEFVDVDADGKVTGVTDTDKIAYKYDNVVIPQNDLPAIKAEMVSIPVVAKARRITIYYSQIAAFQA